MKIKRAYKIAHQDTFKIKQINYNVSPVQIKLIVYTQTVNNVKILIKFKWKDVI